MHAGSKRGSRAALVALLGAVGLALAWAAIPRAAAAAHHAVGVVTYLQGSAQRRAKGGAQWSALAKGSALEQGDRLRTGDSTRFEAKLNDGSMLRLSSNSELGLDTVGVSRRHPHKKRVSVRLFIGRVWASVTHLFGHDSEFQVATPNAVAGVRGTRFNAGVAKNGTTTVKVYDGKVLISNKPIYAVKGATKGHRVQVAGPQVISKKKWEKLVAGAMQMVQVAANGTMTQPQGFQLAKNDAWEQWNNERDKLAGLDKNR